MHGHHVLVGSLALGALAVLGPACSATTDDPVSPEDVTEDAEAIDYPDPIDVTARIVCKRPGIDCMMVCANAGTSCAGRRPHPKSPGVGSGDLYACRTSAPLSCDYRYANGDRCYFYQAPSFVLCRHTRL